MKDTKSPDYLSIKQWAEEDRPREKLLLKGKQSLSEAELMAVLLGSGTVSMSAVEVARKILQSVNNDLHELAKMSVKELQKFKGIGEAKAITIAAALELGRRRRSEDAEELKKITSSKVVFEIMQPIIGELPHEEFWILYLNNSNNVIHKAQLSKGGIVGTVVDCRIVFKTAFEQNATSIILTHNHPSGKLLASNADKEITQKLKIAGKQLDVIVIDHIIITETGYYSFQDEGIF